MTLPHGTDRLESPRLVLRRIAPDDLAFFARIHALPEVAQYLYAGGRPRTAEESAAWLQSALASYEQLELGYLAVVRKDDGAGYGLIHGLAGRSAALVRTRYGRGPLLAAVGVLPVIAYFGMAAFLGWGGILLGILAPIGRGVGEVLCLEALNERMSSTFRATVISMANLGIRASFCLLGPLAGYGIDAWGLAPVLSALGILFSIAFFVLLLPLVVREGSLSPAEGVTP